MTLLVTRPTPDAEPLMQRFYAKGLEALHAPMMTIKPVALGLEAQTALQDSLEQGVARLVFTSANGVRMLLAQQPDATDAPCFCVGQQTAQCAKDKGFQDITIAEGDVESLMETITAQESPPDAQWFHLRGRNHTGGLVQKLQQKHYNIRAICGYNAEPVTALSPEVIAAITSGEVWAIVLYSPRTARLLELLLQLHGLLDYCQDMAVYGLSPAVVQALRADWAYKWSPPSADAALLEAHIVQEGNRS